MKADIYYVGELPSRKWLPWQENKIEKKLMLEFSRVQGRLSRKGICKFSGIDTHNGNMSMEGTGRDIISAKKELELTKKFRVEIKPSKKKSTHRNGSRSEDPYTELTATMLGGFF